MSNDISIVKNVLDKQQHKVSVTNYESRSETSVIIALGNRKNV